MKLEECDIIGMELAYIGCFLMTHWMIWSYNLYGIWGAGLMTYLTSFGGLI